jgi:hypothetical protein
MPGIEEQPDIGIVQAARELLDGAGEALLVEIKAEVDVESDLLQISATSLASLPGLRSIAACL